MVINFIDSALIIDDKESEIEGLIDVLKGQDISVTFLTPDEAKKRILKKNRKLIFLDLSLNDQKSIKDNISTQIRPLLMQIIKSSFGNYGIVVWSNHDEDIDLLKEKIQEDRIENKYPTPLFIIGLSKSKYIKGKAFDTLFEDLKNELLNDPAATFFIEWSNSIKIAQDNSISTIYSLTPDYQNQANDFAYIIKEIAKNYTGIHEKDLGDYPLHIDAYKAFDELLYAEMINCQKNGSNILPAGEISFSKKDNLLNVCAKLNAAFFLDTNNIDQNVIIPGNIYEQMEDNELLKIDRAPKKGKKIIIELTPPCDFSNRKSGYPRIVSGCMIDCPKDSEKRKEYVEKTFKSEARYFIYPILIEGYIEPQFIYFDFRYTTSLKKEKLKDSSKYKIMFRAKPKLFADIIQKFSSHAARLGLSIIHP